jgi:hypothetical protein
MCADQNQGNQCQPRPFSSRYIPMAFPPEGVRLCTSIPLLVLERRGKALFLVPNRLMSLSLVTSSCAQFTIPRGSQKQLHSVIMIIQSSHSHSTTSTPLPNLQTHAAKNIFAPTPNPKTTHPSSQNRMTSAPMNAPSQKTTR